MPTLKPMFYENLQDNIPSVRAGAAQALATIGMTYGEHIQLTVRVRCSSLKHVMVPISTCSVLLLKFRSSGEKCKSFDVVLSSNSRVLIFSHEIL